jgi:hypothetical protein
MHAPSQVATRARSVRACGLRRGFGRLGGGYTRASRRRAQPDKSTGSDFGPATRGGGAFGAMEAAREMKA